MAILNALMTCPECRQQSAEVMPLDRCLFFWECPRCHAVVRPKKGDCCVYCSYADQRCPPVQDERACSES